MMMIEMIPNITEEVLFRKGCVTEKKKWKLMSEIGREKRKNLRKSGNAFWQKDTRIQMRSSRGWNKRLSDAGNHKLNKSQNQKRKKKKSKKKKKNEKNLWKRKRNQNKNLVSNLL